MAESPSKTAESCDSGDKYVAGTALSFETLLELVRLLARQAAREVIDPDEAS